MDVRVRADRQLAAKESVQLPEQQQPSILTLGHERLGHIADDHLVEVNDLLPQPGKRVPVEVPTTSAHSAIFVPPDVGNPE